MFRRTFLGCVFSTFFGGASLADAAFALKKFVFKVKTKSGSIVGNIVIEASDQFAAVAKLMKRYPGCEILEGREK
jgi:hypothetical protein